MPDAEIESAALLPSATRPWLTRRKNALAQAAERESIAASAVSKRISDIEDTVGTPLLLRHRTGVTPTPAGESLLHHARMLLHGIEKMQGELSEYAVGMRGHIHIFASISAIVEFLPDDVSAFMLQHPDISIIPAEAIQPYASALGLHLIPLTDSWAHRQFVICLRDYQTLPVPSRLLVDYMRNK